MRIVPSSTINLYSNIPIDNGEQLAFSSLQAQAAYFNNHLVRSYTPCTMVRKTGALRVEIAGSVISGCNYISFVNPDFDNKTVYARITDYDYINNECVEITYAIDYWQTWMFDISFDSMYIEREHLSEADWQKAETNPYDPTILEFRTGETLPVGRDLEKLHYTIGDVNNDDGFMVGDAVIQSTDYDVDNHIGVLIQLAMIDFEDLDTDLSGNNRPSYKFVTNILTPTKNTDWGFYMLPKATYDYLHSKYASAVPLDFGKGTGWNNDAQLAPNNSSNIKAGYITLFVESGAYAGSPTQMGIVSQLLEYLTQWNCVSAIIGIYPVPNSLMVFSGMSYGTHASSIAVNIDTVKTRINVNSKKLMHYPYSYLRLIAPNGDIKELHFEEFASVQAGNDSCLVDVDMNLTEHPTMIVAPDDYKMSGISPTGGGMEPNMHEALIFNQFPTLPYTIDAFLAQVAAVSAGIIANRTEETAWDLAAQHVAVENEANSFIGNILGVASGIASKVGDAASGLGLSAVPGIAAGAETFGARNRANIEQQAIKENQFMQAGSALAGSDANAITQNMRLTRPAYACNQYHPNNGDGMINFDKMSYIDIVYMRVTLNPQILQIYDKWFQNYGYTSGRCGIPRAIRFTQGASATTELPHWESIDGKYCTYIKTMDCKVTGAMLPVASAIKTMFDSGVRLIKGN